VNTAKARYPKKEEGQSRGLPAELKGPLWTARSLSELGPTSIVATIGEKRASRDGFVKPKVKRYELIKSVLSSPALNNSRAFVPTVESGNQLWQPGCLVPSMPKCSGRPPAIACGLQIPTSSSRWRRISPATARR